MEELRERAAEVRFGAAQCGLTILRYVTDSCCGSGSSKLSLSVLARVVRAATAACPAPLEYGGSMH